MVQDVPVTYFEVTGDRAAPAGARTGCRAWWRAGRRGGFWLWVRLGAGLWAALGPAGAALARGPEFVQGPVAAEVLEVLAGDTLEVVAEIWLHQKITTQVRLAGVSIPRAGSDCAGERQRAAQAKEYLAGLLADRFVSLLDISSDFLFGRVTAIVVNSRNRDLGSELVRAGLATRELPVPSWCAADEKGDAQN